MKAEEILLLFVSILIYKIPYASLYSRLLGAGLSRLKKAGEK